ncbi:MAG: response regulator [Magnetospirillum sp.]|nr:MAG: response regulator [Magnetospirillum sp.]
MTGRPMALIVEDDPEMAAELADLLRSFGHGSIQAESKADALVRLEDGGIAYILLDLQIKADRLSIKPTVSAGMALLDEIRCRFPARAATDMHLLPVLVVSGHAKEHRDVVEAFQRGADDFIRKPLSLAERDFEAKVRHCLERAGDGEPPSVPPQRGVGEGLWHEPDYSEVRLHGHSYRFTGDVSRTVIRLLHEAALRGEPWQSGKDVLGRAGSKALRMRHVFAGHDCWGSLLLSDGHGKYRIRAE